MVYNYKPPYRVRTKNASSGRGRGEPKKTLADFLAPIKRRVDDHGPVELSLSWEKTYIDGRGHVVYTNYSFGKNTFNQESGAYDLGDQDLDNFPLTMHHSLFKHFPEHQYDFELSPFKGQTRKIKISRKK